MKPTDCQAPCCSHYGTMLDKNYTSCAPAPSMHYQGVHSPMPPRILLPVMPAIFALIDKAGLVSICHVVQVENYGHVPDCSREKDGKVPAKKGHVQLTFECTA